MQPTLEARAFAAFVAGLLSGSGLVLLAFHADPAIGQTGGSLLGIGMALLAMMMLLWRRQAKTAEARANRHRASGGPVLGRLEDVAAVVASLAVLRRGFIAQAGGWKLAGEPLCCRRSAIPVRGAPPPRPGSALHGDRSRTH